MGAYSQVENFVQMKCDIHDKKTSSISESSSDVLLCITIGFRKKKVSDLYVKYMDDLCSFFFEIKFFLGWNCWFEIDTEEHRHPVDQ